MKTVYCARCGKELGILRKALPQYQRIIDIVEYHKCDEDVNDPDFLTDYITPSPLIPDDNDEFVKKLNGLNPPSVEPPLPIEPLSDKRPNDIAKSSTAPSDLIDNLFPKGN